MKLNAKNRYWSYWAIRRITLLPAKPREEEGLVAPYKEGLIKKWNIKKFNLDDLYVRFFRMAENRITKTGKGDSVLHFQLLLYQRTFLCSHAPKFVEKF